MAGNGGNGGNGAAIAVENTASASVSVPVVPNAQPPAPPALAIKNGSVGTPSTATRSASAASNCSGKRAMPCGSDGASESADEKPAHPVVMSVPEIKAMTGFDTVEVSELPELDFNQIGSKRRKQDPPADDMAGNSQQVWDC